MQTFQVVVWLWDGAAWYGEVYAADEDEARRTGLEKYTNSPTCRAYGQGHLRVTATDPSGPLPQNPHTHNPHTGQPLRGEPK